MIRVREVLIRIFSLALIMGLIIAPALLSIPSSTVAETVNGVEKEGVEAEAESVDLVPRVAPAKPAHTVIGPGVYPNLVVVKFVEGSKVRLRNDSLINQGSENLTPATDILLQYPGVKVERLFTRPEDDGKGKGEWAEP